MDHHRKRSRSEYEQDLVPSAEPTSHIGMGQTLSFLKHSNDSISEAQSEDGPHDSDKVEWQTVDRKSKKKEKKKQKLSKSGKDNYPAITHSSHARLQTCVRINDLQALVLYLLANGPAPQWVSVRHHGQVRKVVVLMVPGLERAMFEQPSSIGQKITANDDVEASRSAHKESNGDADGPKSPRRNLVSPDDYYPSSLVEDLLPKPLKPLAQIFKHVWPVKTPGDDRHSKMHSPIQAMLSAPLPKAQEEKKLKGPQPPRYGKEWENKPTPITEYLATSDQLHENEYTIHPALLTTRQEQETEAEKRRLGKQTTEDGWIDTIVVNLEDCTVPASEMSNGNTTAGREVLAIDCEMCKTDDKTFELARISVIRWDGSVVLDELVKPAKAIVDYLTPYSGMTKEKLDPVTTMLHDIQMRLLTLLTPRTILVGHSLDSDLAALKLTHPCIIDTSILYPHPRGPPLKSSLKWLAQKYLSREIQKNSTTGHDSIEDARAALDLVKVKCQRGPSWGTSDAASESIFKRIARSSRSGTLAATTIRAESGNSGEAVDNRTGALVDWGFPKRGYGAAADVCIGCSNDAEVVDGVRRAVLGDADGAEIPGQGTDFVWARMRELEAVKGWWSGSKTADNEALLANARTDASASDITNMTCGNWQSNRTRKHISTLKTSQQTSTDADVVPGDHDKNGTDLSILTDAVAKLVARIKDIYDGLPPCTAFIVYSGTGDPRELSRLQTMHQQYKKEFAVKKWDQLSVHWTDFEEQALKKACRKARDGIGFVTVK